MERRKNVVNVRQMTIIGVLGAISIVLGMTPLGFIPIGPTKATIMHIPVIIGGILEGPLVGGLVGLIFGLFSIFQAITNPTPVSFVFLNPIISVVPRVLIGVVAYYIYAALKKLGNKKANILLYIMWTGILLYLGYGIYSNISEEFNLLSLFINTSLIIITLFLAYYTEKKFKHKSLDVILATVGGTLVNTVGVLSLIYFIYGERFVEGLGGNPTLARKVIFGIGVTNGIPEAIIGIIIVTSVVGALKDRI